MPSLMAINSSLSRLANLFSPDFSIRYVQKLTDRIAIGAIYEGLLCLKLRSMNKLFQLILMAFSMFAFSCVPMKQMQELEDKYDKCEENRKYLNSENTRMEKELAEAQSNLRKLEMDIKELVRDTARRGVEWRQLKYQYGQLRETNEELIDKQAQLTSGTQAENQKLLAELLKIQEDLQNKEDSLKLLAYDLNVQEEDLRLLGMELESREARVKELEDLLNQKDRAVRELKDQIKAALVGFEDKGITVEQRNGRVYVSMEAKLLFASGSTVVSAEGSKAVVQLAKALEGKMELTVLVEGHTDTDEMRGSGPIKDNWDLSVMRATSVVRIMLENSNLDPLVLTAAGRGEHNPVASNDTPEGKAKNRRIEVILTPNLDQLFEILENSQ